MELPKLNQMKAYPILNLILTYLVRAKWDKGNYGGGFIEFMK